MGIVLAPVNRVTARSQRDERVADTTNAMTSESP